MKEKTVTDSDASREGGGVGDGSRGERQRQATQQVLPARLPPLLQDLILSQRNDDTATAMQQQPIYFCGAEQETALSKFGFL